MRRVVLTGAVAGAAFFMTTPAMADTVAPAPVATTSTAAATSEPPTSGAPSSEAATTTAAPTTSEASASTSVTSASAPESTTAAATTEAPSPTPTDASGTTSSTTEAPVAPSSVAPKPSTPAVPEPVAPTGGLEDTATVKVSPGSVALGAKLTVTGKCNAGDAGAVVALSNDPEFQTAFAAYAVEAKADGSFSVAAKVARNEEGDVNPRIGQAYALVICVPADDSKPVSFGGAMFRVTGGGVGGSLPSQSPTATATKPSASTSTAPVGGTTSTASMNSTPGGAVSTPAVVETGTVAPGHSNNNLLIGAGVVSLLAGGGVMAFRKRLN